MPCQCSGISDHAIIAHPAIMGHMRISHKEIIIPDARHASPIDRPAIDGHEFTDNIVLTDLKKSHFPTLVFFILRIIPDGSMRENTAILADLCPSRNSHVSADLNTIGQTDISLNNNIRADNNIIPECCLETDHRCWMYLICHIIYSPNAKPITASHATCPSTLHTPFA